MNALILHHFESYWESDLANHGTSLKSEMNKILDFLNHTEIDKIIVTQFEGIDFGPEHQLLINYCESNNILLEQRNYGYGWVRTEDNEEQFPVEDFNKTWCNTTREYNCEEDIVVIEDWQHQLKSNFEKIYVGGAFFGECISDLVAALTAIQANFETINGLIVGEYLDYEWKGFNPEKLNDKIDNAIGLLEDLIVDKSEELECEESFEALFKKDPLFIKTIEESLNQIMIENIKDINSFDLDLYSENKDLQSMIEYIRIEEKEHQLYYNAYIELNKLMVLNIIDSHNLKNNSSKKKRMSV